MDSLRPTDMEIVVSTFVNCHLFWIIDKRKNLLLRSAISQRIFVKEKRKLSPNENLVDGELVAVHISNIWARAVVKQLIQQSNEETFKFICWLPDYGTMCSVDAVFTLFEDMKKLPFLATQATLYNVVNMVPEITFGSDGCGITYVKTIDNVEGVRKAALNQIENAEKLFFRTIKEDKYNLCGDVLCQMQEKTYSLTRHLIDKQLLASDSEMFKAIESSTAKNKDAYFKCSRTWHTKIDLPERAHLSKIIFNSEENKNYPDGEFFTRGIPNHNNLDDSGSSTDSEW